MSTGPSPAAAEAAPLVGITESVRAAAGTSTAVEVVITNRAAAPRNFSVMMLGGDTAWLPAPVQLTDVAPGQSVTVTLALSPAPGALPARYPLAVAVQALDPRTGHPAPAPTTTANTQLVVSPRTQVAMTVSPTRATAISGKRISVALHNRGDQEARLRLKSRTSAHLALRGLPKGDVVLAGGEQRTLTARARFSRVRMSGYPVQHAFILSGHGTEALPPVEGALTQRAVFGAGLVKFAALVAVLAIWLGAAVVFIPRLSDMLQDRRTPETSVTAGDAPAGDGSGADAGGDSGSEGGKGSGAGEGGSNDGEDGEDGTGGEQVQLSGTIQADDPQGVTVSLQPTSLVDEEAQGATPVNLAPMAAQSISGRTVAMRPMPAFLTTVPRVTAPIRTAQATRDGSWTFPAVDAPGYYLLTFHKPGYQTQRFVVDSIGADAQEPLTVELASGQGRLSGQVTGPGKRPVGGATVTITDGINTLTTSSNTRGQVGAWSVDGLSTPGSYVVEVSKDGFGAESRLVRLDAGGSARADLKLQAGVASLVGRVRTRTDSGALAGAGGVTVTVTGSSAASGPVERTVTTLTEGAVGRYTVPGLAVPGTYTVSFSADGMQTQTSRIRLRAGDSRAVRNADLVAATGVVTGRVLADDSGGLTGAGLVLANEAHTYKTTSTSQPAGAFRFNGVAAGTYTLSTQIFGYVTDHVTVEVGPGRVTQIDSKVTTQTGGVLPASSRVIGSVVDAVGGAHVDCPGGAGEACLTATVEEPESEDRPAETFTTSFLASEQYTLPKGEAEGLRPGLRTVRIRAPHYEETRVRVEVPLGQTVVAPVAELYPAPKVGGRVTPAVGAFSGPTCVWVVPEESTEAAPDCAPDDPVADPTICTPTPAFFDPEASRDVGVCAVVAANGSYSIELPRHGVYQVHVLLSDSEYVEPPTETVNLARAASLTHNVRVDRLGRLRVTTRIPGSSGDLVPAPNTEVQITAPDGEISTKTTNGSGVAQFAELSGGLHTLTASFQEHTGTTTAVVALNEERSVSLPITKPIGGLVGQVTANVGGTLTRVKDAVITASFVTDYDNDQAVREEITFRSRDDGCFALRSATLPAVPAACTDGAWSAGPSLVERLIQSTAVPSLRITAPGYEELVVPARILSAEALNSFTLVPTPVAFAATMTTDPQVSGIDWSKVGFRVEPAAGPSSTIQLRAEARDGDTSVGHLVWSDPPLLPGQIKPGDYLITASLTGHLDASATLSCQVGGACQWSGDGLVLPRLGSLTVQVRDDQVPPSALTQGTVTLRRGTTVQQTVQLAGQSAVTFGELVPGDATYSVEVRVAGHRFTTVGNGAAGCGSPTITIERGGETECQVTVPRLGTITGDVEGVLAASPALTPVRSLSGVDVRVTRCTAWVPADAAEDEVRYCTEVDDSQRFTARTNESGRYVVTGDLERQGLVAGTWLVTATDSDFALAGPPDDAPAGALPGVAVPVTGGGTATADLRLHIKLAGLRVRIRDNGNTLVPGATVQLERGDEQFTASPVAGSPGSYLFTGMVPGNYTLSASGAGLYASTVAVEILPGGGEQEFTMIVGRASNTLVGSARDAATGTLLEGAQVSVLCPEDPGHIPCTTDGVVMGTDGVPLRASTGSQGRFTMRSVPDGEFELEIAQHGYATVTVGPLSFSHLQGALPSQDLTLDPVTRPVTITVTSTHSQDTGRGSIPVQLSQPGQTPQTVNLTHQTDSPGTYSGHLDQVRFGCWSVAVSIAEHTGSLDTPDFSGPEDPELDCPAGRLAVSGGTEAGEATAEYSLQTALVEVTSGVTALPGHPLPSDPLLRIGNGATTWHSSAATVGGLVRFWVTPGTGTVTLTAGSSASVFWPPVSSAALEFASGGTYPVALTLQEAAGVVDLSVTGAPALPAGTAVTVEIAPGDDQSADLPTGYDSVTFTAGSREFTLPSGRWEVVISAPGYDPVTQTWNVTALTQTRSAELTATPPPDPPEDEEPPPGEDEPPEG